MQRDAEGLTQAVGELLADRPEGDPVPSTSLIEGHALAAHAVMASICREGLFDLTVREWRRPSN